MLSNKYVSKILTAPNHPLINFLREMCERVKHPLVAVNIDIERLLIEFFEEIERMTHLIASFEVPTFCSTEFESISYIMNISFHEGYSIQRAPVPQTEFLFFLGDDLDEIDLFFTNGIEMSGKNHVGYAIFRINNKTLIQRRSNIITSFFFPLKQWLH